MSGIETVPKSAGAASPPVAESALITGRTAYDAAVEVVRMFGRAAPYFVLVAALLFVALKWYEADQSKIAAVQEAQSKADAKYAAQIQDLNQRLQDNSKSLEDVRSQQLDGLKKLIELSDTITATVAKSQEDLIAQRNALLTAQNDVRAAQEAKGKAESQIRQLLAQRAELEHYAAKAENTIDAATRLAGYLVEQELPGTDKTALSRRFENNDPTRISREDSGMMFYGTFRIPGNEMASFIEYLDNKRPSFALKLNDAGGSAAAVQGSDEFRAEWQSLTRDRAFESLQKDWIDTNSYQPFTKRLQDLLQMDDIAFDANQRSIALQAVLWSVVLQHGRQTPIVRRAWTGINVAQTDDRVLICQIYVERRKFTLYFKGASEATIALLNARFALEEKEALRMLSTGADSAKDVGCGS